MIVRGFVVLFAVALLLVPECASAAAPVNPADTMLKPASWEPMEGSPPVTQVEVGGIAVLKMQCPFQDDGLERASWDCDVSFDLFSARALEFDFYCKDSAPVAGFTFYFRSGEGWYSTSFAAERVGEWNTIRIDRMAMKPEGAPKGWGHIDRVRISAWRGLDKDTEFFVGRFRSVAAAGRVAVVQAESSLLGSGGSARTVKEVCGLVAEWLDQLGIGFRPISDVEISAEVLSDTAVVILPYNPGLAEETVAVLKAFLERGGKLLSFYQLPADLAKAVGMRPGAHMKAEPAGLFSEIRACGGVSGMPSTAKQASWNITTISPIEGQAKVAAYWYDDQGVNTEQPAILVSSNGVHMTHILLRDNPAQKRILLLSMLGHLLPDCWAEASKAQVASAGSFGPYTGSEEALQAIRALDTNSRAKKLLGEVEECLGRAQKLLLEGKHLQVLQDMMTARKSLMEAYCVVQKPQAGEHRAFWCHDAHGVSGMTWDEAIKRLADNGFTAILPNMLWGGSAYYESTVLPVAPSVKERGDQIKACLAACKKYGLECHVWKVNWNMGGHAPEAFRTRMQQEGRIQVSLGGNVQANWLCPSHPANQQLEIDAMVEVATKYDVDGIHFDYIRYPDMRYCFCPGCRERFEKYIGRAIPGWPRSVSKDDELREAWNEFRRTQITRVVSEVSKAVREQAPEVEISAAVFRTWPQDRDTIGQDWKLWCDKGYLDFVCPMDYTEHNAQFEDSVRQQLEWTGDTPCYPGIGFTVWPDSDRIVKLIEQIGITRKLKTGGFTVFNYGKHEADNIVPRCGLGITRRVESKS